MGPGPPPRLDWLKLLHRLTLNEVRFIVIGGVAATLRGSPVATFDVDVCAPMDDENVLKIHQALKDLNPRFRFRPDLMRVPEDPSRLYGIRNLNLATDLGAIDLLGELPNICNFKELQERSTMMDVGGFSCRVIDLDTLLAAKRSAGREKDALNIMHLEAIRRAQQNQPGLFDSPKD